MNISGIELPATLTSGSAGSGSGSPSPRTHKTLHPREKVSLKNSPRSTRERGTSRFKSALSKSLRVRSRNLKRRLTYLEYRQLVRAVRKQVSLRVLSQVEQVYSLIDDRLKRLEHAVPQTPLQLADSIGMYAAQVAVLREQAFRAIMERDELAETCAHFQHKRILYLSSQHTISKAIAGQGLIYVAHLALRQVVCCASCLAKREEAALYWTGTDMSDFEEFESPTLKELKSDCGGKVHPLAIGPIWTSLLNVKYQRNV